jgi:hypothetical protein
MALAPNDTPKLNHKEAILFSGSLEVFALGRSQPNVVDTIVFQEDSADFFVDATFDSPRSVAIAIACLLGWTSIHQC